MIIHGISNKLFTPLSSLIGFIVIISLVIIVGININNVAHASAIPAFDPGRIIDDDIFTLSGSMSAPQIQTFLNSKVPTCDTNGTQPASDFGRSDLTHAQYAATRGWPAPPYPCLKDYSENGKSAAQIIFDAAQQYSINPQVLIVLLQKEQGLVTDTWPLPTQYSWATGYRCPDHGSCDPAYAGLTKQINGAASDWHYAMTPNSGYWSGFILNANNYIQYNPDTNCGGSTVYISTRATWALYTYTPYQPNPATLSAPMGTTVSCGAYGNLNFYRYFTSWFGSTQGNTYYTCRNGTNIQGVASGEKLLRNRIGGSSDNISLILPNNTGTGCAEVHTWLDNKFQTWFQHIGTNSYTFNPSSSSVISMRIGANITRFFKVDLQGTASGRLEVHGWDSTVQHWTSHIATISGPIDPTNSSVIAADTNGDGVDELYIVNYTGTASGMVEIHGLSTNLQQWIRHTATNLPAIDPSKGRVVAADINGNGKDEFIYIKYGDVQSGMVEVHVWSPNLQQWVRHTATNLPVSGFNVATDDFLTADTNGDGVGEIMYVKYSNTSSGRVEIHGWSADQQQWISHIATSVGSF